MIRKAAFLAFALFFWIANRGAYRGYFDGDDLDNLAMTSEVSTTDLLQLFVTPKLAPSNFRPVGHAFYRYLGPVFRLDYPKYILAIHVLHLINVLLLWLLLNALGFEGLTAAFGLLLFAFNMGVFEIYWKPMYVFDLLCATFCLSSLLLWVKDRWILSLLTFWCAYRAKEVAIGLPIVLLLFEWHLGRKRWWRLAPFFAVSASFGLQALVANQGRDNAYTFRFTREAFTACLKFYDRRILLFPFGAAVLAALAFAKDRLARIGVASFFVLLAPMLFLPGRLFGAYLYVPLIGAAIAAAAFANQVSRPIVAALILVWIPVQFREMQIRRNPFLASCDDSRRYVDTLQAFVKSSPETDRFAYFHWPEDLHWWGVRGAARVLTANPNLQFADFDSPEAFKLLAAPGSAELKWIAESHELKILAHKKDAPDAAYLKMNYDTPVWQLGEGWRGPEEAHRWMKLEAHAHLHRPESAKRFEVIVNVGPALIDAVHRATFEVLLDGRKIGVREFTTPGWVTLQFDAPPSNANTEVTFKTSPGFFLPGQSHDADNAYGMAIGSFGFPPR